MTVYSEYTTRLDANSVAALKTYDPAVNYVLKHYTRCWVVHEGRKRRYRAQFYIGSQAFTLSEPGSLQEANFIRRMMALALYNYSGKEFGIGRKEGVKPPALA